MNYETLQVFWAIHKTGSITKAAEALYMSQSAVSQRLQQLEAELETPLVIRGRGQKNVEFTPQGKSLLSIAEQLIQLYDAALMIKDNSNRTRLRIGGVDSVNSYVFPDFFQGYMQRNKNVDLTLYTHHSWEIYELLESGEIDIGIVNNDMMRAHANIVTEMLFREEYVVLRPKGADQREAGSSIHPTELNFSDEVFQSFDLSYQQWHNLWWPSGQSRVQVNTASMLTPFFCDSDCWSIVPHSIARLLAEKGQLIWFNLLEAPQERACYIATCRRKKVCNAKVIEQFIKELKQHLNELRMTLYSGPRGEAASQGGGSGTGHLH